MTEKPTYNPWRLVRLFREHGRLVEKMFCSSLTSGDKWALKKIRERIDRVEMAAADGDTMARFALDHTSRMIRKEMGYSD